MKKIFRLQKSWEFDAVIKTKKQVVNKYMIIYFRPATEFKAGITVPTKFCNAVLRNYYKRQMKSIIHSLNIYDMKFHLVVILRKEFLNQKFKTKLLTTEGLIKKIRYGK
ncbi:ribonuclease P protein component [Mycoplasma simbae]|uniref:ribonuclease P protein component n=1 Tax=Mycoplasma simbae TaxID=36744 RepID=UPI0004961BC9|nr:ribonuclease P protein component [Mycoplasma simbae]